MKWHSFPCLRSFSHGNINISWYLYDGYWSCIQKFILKNVYLISLDSDRLKDSIEFVCNWYLSYKYNDNSIAVWKKLKAAFTVSVFSNDFNVLTSFERIKQIGFYESGYAIRSSDIPWIYPINISSAVVRITNRQKTHPL